MRATHRPTILILLACSAVVTAGPGVCLAITNDTGRCRADDPVLPASSLATPPSPRPPATRKAAPDRVPPLPSPTGEVVHVRTAQELLKALDAARPGQTIMLADGLYDVSGMGFLHLARDNLTLRGASGDSDKVVLKGKGFKTHDIREEMIKIEACGVTVADLTVRDVGANGIKLCGGNHNLLVHNVHFIDITERCIKAPHAPESRNGIVRYCVFEQVTPITSDIPHLFFRGDYIAGMDMMHIDGWRIHDNVFKNIHGRNHEGRAGVFLWQGCRDCIVERNTFIKCDRGVSFGNPSGRNDMTGGVIRNNFFCNNAAQAIEICHATDVKVYNNSIYHMDNVVDKRTISVEDSRDVDIRNNLVFSTDTGVSGRGYTQANNVWLTDASLAERFFVNPAACDLHLKPAAAEAIGKGMKLPEVEDDWDGDPRGDAPDTGADQITPSGPVRRTPSSSPASEPASLPSKTASRAASAPFDTESRTDLVELLKFAPKAPPLPEAEGTVVRVFDVTGLRNAVDSAEPGTTILLADGRYPVERLVIRTDRLGLRGESGDRDKVVLDGGGKLTRIVVIEGGKDLLFADLTVANSLEYGICFYGDADAQRLKLYNVKFFNCLTRGLKGTDAAKVRDSWTQMHPPEIERQLRPTGGEVRYCLFVNDRPSPRSDLYSGDYIGGIDIMSAREWTVADNIFVDIRGQRGQGRGAIFFWINGENVTAERNTIVGCDRGICFGNPATPLGKSWHMAGGIIRNNFIACGAGEGIEVCRAKDVLVAHNTIWMRQPKERAVRFHVATPGCRLVNDLIRGTIEAPSENKGEGNILGALDGWFNWPEIGDLHLTSKAKGAIGKAKRLPEVPEDFDRQRRKVDTDVGADEAAPAASAASQEVPGP